MKSLNKKRGYVGTLFKGTAGEINVIVSDKTSDNVCYVYDCKKR